MQEPVIVVLLITGALCVVMQALVTILSTSNSKGGAGSAGRSKSKADSDDDPGAMDRFRGAATRIFNVESAERARLGMLGLVLLLIAAILVLDFEFTVTVANITEGAAAGA